MKYFLLLLSALCSFNTAAQQKNIVGYVLDQNKSAVFAANVYLKQQPRYGTNSDIDGYFDLPMPPNAQNDTLVVSFIGYQTQFIALQQLNSSNTIILPEDAQLLKIVSIESRLSIADNFAITQLNALDIYLDPISQGDPLKAITAQAASTTTDESASPSLRGSDADKTRVILNNVPIYNPIRNGQLNGVGNFSLFNTEIIQSQNTYASNPPLTTGNSSAGLIEINTISQLPKDNYQISLTLANVGALISKKIGKNNFVQLYSNYQFSPAFIALNKKNATNLNNFGSNDIGTNVHFAPHKNLNLNLFAYYIDEHYDVNSQNLSYSGTAIADKKRNFTVFNLKYQLPKGVLFANNGTNHSNATIMFGNINSNTKISQVFSSLQYKHFFNNQLSAQIGIDHQYNRYQFDDHLPIFYYALNPSDPTFVEDTALTQHIVELFAYTKYTPRENLFFAAAVRTNLTTPTTPTTYFSYQISTRYDLSSRHSLLLAAGHYHSYTTPGFYIKQFSLLDSYQVAIDYSYKRDNTDWQAAAFWKQEKGTSFTNNFSPVSKSNILGMEVSYRQTIKKYLSLFAAYTYLAPRIQSENKTYRGEKNLPYLFKASINYNHPKIANIALTYAANAGTYYTPIETASFNGNANTYEPTYSSQINSTKLNPYNSFSFSVSRYIAKKQFALIPFLNISNLFNTKNQAEPFYNYNYTEKIYSYFQERNIYFGIIAQFFR